MSSIVPDSGAARPLKLALLRDELVICKLGAFDPIPAWATARGFFSITRTADELSVVCPQDMVPDGTACERDWRAVRVAGTIPFSAVGVLASLTTPLAASGISIFALSTYNTDYLLVKAKDLTRALDALRRYGHVIEGQ